MMGVEREIPVGDEQDPPEYTACLQAEEEECALDCGCVLSRRGAEVLLYQCPLHEAAHEVKEALERLYEATDILMQYAPEGCVPVPLGLAVVDARQKARGVLAKVGGGA